jgi:hypothetical protein
MTQTKLEEGALRFMSARLGVMLIPLDIAGW